MYRTSSATAAIVGKKLDQDYCLIDRINDFILDMNIIHLPTPNIKYVPTYRRCALGNLDFVSGCQAPSTLNPKP